MEDERARVVEVVVVGDVVADVPVLLRRAGGVELLELEPPVDDRLQQIERPDRVRHERLVRPMPRLTDVGLRAEMEDVRLVGCTLQLTDEIVDRGAIREVGEMHLELSAAVTDVVERAARGRANEGVDVGAERDQRLGEVRPHESVGTGDEHRATAVDVAEVAAQRGVVVLGPSCVVSHSSRRFLSACGSPGRLA